MQYARPIVTDVWRGRPVGLSVTRMYPAKTTEPIEMPFGMRARVGTSNHVLVGIRLGKGQFWGSAYMSMPTVDIFKKTMQPFIEFLRSLV